MIESTGDFSSVMPSRQNSQSVVFAETVLDVKCTFRILKGRWRILKCGVRVHGVDKVDIIWLTCCALHNWLLEIDGLSNVWTGEQVADSNAESDWLGGVIMILTT